MICYDDQNICFLHQTALAIVLYSPNEYMEADVHIAWPVLFIVPLLFLIVNVYLFIDVSFQPCSL